MVLERSSQISTIGLLGQHLNLDLRCVPLFAQPHPTKSSTFDGNFDGNYMAGTRLHELFQSLTDQLDPTHSHHLIKYLGLFRHGANVPWHIIGTADSGRQINGVVFVI